jgi:6-phosphofructo-2-kinase / fructose-2,6-biphosphatase 2
MDPEQAVADFRNRIKHYEDVYETVDEDTSSYVKVIDIGRKVIINNVTSYLPSRIVFFSMNLHNTPRRIFLTRHGQSEFNAAGRIGGDGELTETGDDYAHAFAEWTLQNLSIESGRVTIFTSTMKRTIQTTQYIPSRKVRPKSVKIRFFKITYFERTNQLFQIRLKSLDEIDAGEFDGMTYEEIARKFPNEYAARAKDKLVRC